MTDRQSLSAASLEGVWHRLLEEAPPLGRGGTQDRSTTVLWTQARHSGIYVDLRLPLGHPGRLDSPATEIVPRPSALAANGYSQHAKQVILSSSGTDTDETNCSTSRHCLYQTLLTTQSFAGVLTVQNGDATPLQVVLDQDPVLKQLSALAAVAPQNYCSTDTSSIPPPLFTSHWHRHIDCQPPATRLDIGVCAPQLPPAANGALLLRETGDDASYAEDWLLLGNKKQQQSNKPTCMAAALQSENGMIDARRGYWVWTDTRFAYAIGYPQTVSAAQALGTLAATVQIHQATPGTKLEELLPQLVGEEVVGDDDDDDDDDDKKKQVIDVLGSYIAVAGKVATRQDGTTRDWMIEYSTHAELVGCSFLSENSGDHDKNAQTKACSRIDGWVTDDKDCFTQYIDLEDGQVLERVWKVEEQENLPSVPRNVFGMDAHPDFVDVDMPRTVNLPSFYLTPLSPAHAQEDYEAVVASTRVLQGLLGNDWPVGLTPEDNLIDLSWHDREFTLQRSFSWIVRAPTKNDTLDGTYVGCAYVFPEQGCRGKAKVVTWIRERTDRTKLLEKLNRQFEAWLEDKLDCIDILLEW